MAHERRHAPRGTHYVFLTGTDSIVRRYNEPMRIRRVINRASTVLCIVCMGVLVILVAIDITTGYMLCEGYLSGFFAYAFIFALIAYFTQPISNRSP